MSDLEALLDSRDALLSWVATNAPELHACAGWRVLHRGDFAHCDDEPCASAHEAITEAYRVMEAS